MYSLSTFGLPEMTLVGATLRAISRGAPTFEEASQRAAQFFYDQFVDSTGRPAFVLSRCYATLELQALPDELADFAQRAVPDSLEPTTRCLTLLGSFGEEEAWKSRAGSTGHRAIPLPSVARLEDLPMVARLTASLGLSADEVVNPDPSFLLEKERQGFNVFHVENALHSRYIPAQDGFVERFGVRSVVGFGFVLPPAHVFTTILFARETVRADIANLFKTLALSLKLAMLGVADKPLFRESST